MRRSICVSEPNFAVAGETRTWKFCYTTATALPKGTKIRFHLGSKGRDIDWEVPSVEPKAKTNAIWAEMPDGQKLYATEVVPPDHWVPFYDFTLPAEIKPGDTLQVCLGSPDATRTSTSGSRCQKLVQRRRPFFLYIDPKGKSDFKEPEVFAIDIRGDVLHHIRILAPSMVARNRRFDVYVRFEDEYGNLTGSAAEGTLLELSHEHLRDSLHWKLFVPETGFLTIPNLYFNEPGNYRIQLHNLTTKNRFFSAPIRCLPEGNLSIYWGCLHGESEKFDSHENVELFLRQARDEKAYQFAAVSPFESVEETTNEEWKLMSTQVAEFDEESRFVTFLGFQWHEVGEEEGLRHMIYSKDLKPLLRKKESKNSNLGKIYKGSSPKEILSIPCFTMAKGYETTFTTFSPEFERVVEIYNAWGSSECEESEGNLRPIRSEGKDGITSIAKGSIRAALRRGCRFGFVAGGLDDRDLYQPLFESGQVQYSPGLTAILAEQHTRESLFLALQQRRCYATTGPRIVVGFSIAGATMGQELSAKAKPGLAFNRHLTGYIIGTAPLKEVEILRNGTVWRTLYPQPTGGDPAELEFAVDDTEPLGQCALTAGEDQPPFIFYYLRAIQEDGHIAWSSPIWVDFVGGAVTPGSTKAPKKSKK